jgi:DcaP outer membrane protein
MKLIVVTSVALAGALPAASSSSLLAADPEVEALNEQVKVLEKKVAELEKDKAKAAAAAAAGGAARTASFQQPMNDQAGAAPRPTVPGQAQPVPEEDQPPAIPPGRPSPVPPRDTFNDEQEAAPRPDDLLLSNKFRGFIPVPNTPVLIKFNAKPRVDFTWDPRNTGNNSKFVTATIPLDGSPDHGGGSVFNINAKGSRLMFDVRAPQVAGTPRFYFENDFFGSGPQEFNFRVRHIYGQIYNVIVGQTFSVFEDPDIWPDTVDFQGPNSMLSRRRPQARYQLPLSKEWNLNFSLEQPGSQPSDFVDSTTTPATTTTVNGANHMPDGGMNARWEKADVGHVQLSTILRDVSSKEFTAAGQTLGRDSVFGWGLNLAGSFQVFKRDSVQSQITYGEGIGSYSNDASTFKTDGAFNESNNLVALPYFGLMVGYTHWWAEQWRSTVSYGYVDMDNEASQGPTAYNKTHYVSLNIVSQIRKRLSVGLEGLYGVNTVANGDRGDAFRLQVGLIYKLFD